MLGFWIIFIAFTFMLVMYIYTVYGYYRQLRDLQIFTPVWLVGVCWLIVLILGILESIGVISVIVQKGTQKVGEAAHKRTCRVGKA